jgi:hypothetical protein
MRRAITVLVSLCLLAALTTSALAKPNNTLTFKTGSFVITCTSTGQVCSPAEPLTFNIPRKGALTSVTYTTAATHCSAIRVSVLLKGNTVAKLPRLDAGDATATVKPDVKLKKGSTTLGFRAKGFTGGCNAGQLGSWGGKVTIKVKLD